MTGIYFVEILNHSGDVQSRQRLTTLPIRIGRAYDNDVILDDLHTAAHHALVDINEDGALVIRDLGSHNTLRRKSSRGKNNHPHYKGVSELQKNEFLIAGDSVFHLGHTQIRVRMLDYKVAPELIDATNYRWQGWPLAFAAFFMIGLIAFSNTWLSDIDNNKSTSYIINICIWLGYAMTWAGIWALANRVFGGAAHFSRHLFILSCGLSLLYFWGYLAISIAYSFSFEIVTRYGSHLEIALFAATVYYHLCQITPRRTQRLGLICASLALLGSGLMLMKNLQGTNQYADELYLHDILPPAMRLSRNHSIKEFEVNIDQLKIDVDAERARALSDNSARK
jgi:FHA domain